MTMPSFIKQESLDAVLVLGSSDEEQASRRTKRAAQEKDRTKVFIVTGGKTPALSRRYSSEAQMMYEQLVKEGVNPLQIREESYSQNTLQNILNSIPLLHGKKIGIVSEPRQLDRVQIMIRKAKQQGLIDKDLEVYRIETPITLKEKIYEVPAGILERYRLSEGIPKRKTNEAESLMKRIFRYIDRHK